MRLRLLALGVLLAGCGSTGAPVPPAWAPSTPTTPAAVDFPVAAVPRPIVLMGPPLVNVVGYGSDAEKVAASSGRFSFTGAEPATPGPTSVFLPDGRATFPLIGARDAVAAMSADRGEGMTLELVSAELSTVVFQTDRGALELPAWKFRTPSGSVLAWPAITPDAFWKFGEVRYALHHATTTGDGVQLEVELPAPTPPCPGEAETVTETVVVEAATSVTVGLRTVSEGDGNCARDAMYRTRTHTVRLKEPLGARVLLDENNGVIPVTTR
ncbi:hypothetical protein ALI22I_33490 [Saccharothrix sp. ALI-22-I]|uniref:hypothetical protein n=1 Tax=Saccharothrix sp. ALI-22-I TaxID=1933778 RepID=UPI00097BE07F|nr:hypothetical protein [Saccharothrix sp. ALI-22-I]ONI83428.1 hypothetical protein ALI22I_33490 [Saccharothrix sp. ALI-22-I]